MKRRHTAGPAREMLRAARSRAKRKGLPYDLEVEDLTVPATCPVLNIPIKVGTRQEKNNAPSLDRIIPEKGYVKGNVRVISHRANTLKSNATVKELEAVVRYLKGEI